MSDYKAQMAAMQDQRSIMEKDRDEWRDKYYAARELLRQSEQALKRFSQSWKGSIQTRRTEKRIEKFRKGWR